MFGRIFSEKVGEKIVDKIFDSLSKVTYLSVIPAYFTDIMHSWAPLSWVILVISLLIASFYLNNLSLDRKIKNRQLKEKIESYIEFNYENGIVVLKTKNAYIAHAHRNGNAPIVVFILFEENIDFSSINITPKCKWRKINFHNKYAIFEIWDVKDGNYNMTFI